MKEKRSNKEINSQSKSIEGKRVVVILCCYTSGKCYISVVLYAAQLGTCRLDLDAVYSRTDIYGLESDISSDENVPLDYLPEDDSYCVVNITVDQCFQMCMCNMVYMYVPNLM